MVKARSRLVSFRLSQDELDRLKVACLMQDARNVSDFARHAVLEQVKNPREHAEAQLLDRFSGLLLRLGEIEAALKNQTEAIRLFLSLAVDREKAQGA